jgi:sigma-B regulation protein RsbU (phosphoserine phosphatase)
VGRLDYASHKLAYVNAGHDRPLFLRQGASRIVELTSTGTPLGMFPGSSYGACEELPVHERDLLLLTTDGVWEARNRAGVGFGKARLREVLARNAARDVHDIVGAIVKEVEDHLGASPPQDDLSLAVVRRRGG